MSDTGTATAAEAQVSTQKSGGKGLRFTKGQFEGGWRGVAVLYWREKDGDIELMAAYTENAPQKLKDEIAARFGVAAHEWKIRED